MVLMMMTVHLVQILALASASILMGCQRDTASDGTEGASPGSGWTSASGRVAGVDERPVEPVFELGGFWVHVAESVGVRHSMGFRFQADTYQRTTRGQVIESGRFDVVSQTPERWELLLMPEQEAGGGEERLVLRPTPDASGFTLAGARDVVYSRREDPEPELHNAPPTEASGDVADEERPSGGSMRLGGAEGEPAAEGAVAQ